MEEKQQQPEKAKILVVDDDPGVAESLSEFLQEEGFETDFATSGEEALEKLYEKTYDLMITDVVMPGKINGLSLLQRLREEFKNPPAVVVMTGAASYDGAVEAGKYGAIEYIVKPFKLPEILKLVEKALKIKKVEGENFVLKQMLENYRASEELVEIMDEEKIYDLLVESSIKTTFADVAFVGRYDEKNKKCIYKKGLSTREDIDPEELFKKIDFPFIEGYFQEGKIILFSDEEVGKVFLDKTPQMGITSILMVPLRAGGKHLGTVAVASLSKVNKFTDVDKKALFLLASRAGVSLKNVELFKDLQKVFTETIQSLVRAVEAKDQYTRGHSERVAFWAEILAKKCGCSDEMVENIRNAALLHDIGKIGMDLSALKKSTALTEDEMELFRTHPEVGKKILEPINFFKPIIPMVYYHHERWDGNGYPEGLKGEHIPVGARIIAIADSFDVMTTDRPYRKRLPFKSVIHELVDNMGTQFDPQLTRIFLNFLVSDEGKKAIKTLLPEYYEENREAIESFTEESLQRILQEKYREAESL